MLYCAMSSKMAAKSSSDRFLFGGPPLLFGLSGSPFGGSVLVAAVMLLGASAGRGLGGGLRLGGFAGSSGTQASEQYFFRQSRSSFPHVRQYRFSFAVLTGCSGMTGKIIDQ
jgi:hypothetical protein